MSLLSVILVLGIAPPATAKGEPNSSEITAEQAEVYELEEDIADGFETMFTKVVVPNENGVWEVDPEAAAEILPEMSMEELQSAADLLNAEEQSAAQTRSAGAYGRCVAESFLPGFINYSDAVRIGQRLRAKDWKGAANVLTQASATAAAGNALEYGASQGLREFLKKNPAVFTARIVVYAASCALTT